MPRIKDFILDCAIYLYPTRHAAEDGEGTGGSGFMVRVESKHAGYWFPYAVTNSHVIREAASPIIRMNTKDGKFAVIEVDPDAWSHHPDGDDLAVASLAVTGVHKYQAVPEGIFITQEVIDKHKIGPGEDVYMVGRFVSHEGRQKNTPSVRFGAVSQMNNEPILHERGFMQESFLVESRSIPGYSGAPVFVEIPALSKRPDSTNLELKTYGPWLLGVDWCHLYEELLVLDKDGESEQDETGQKTGRYVEANTGMMGVIPAWKLKELLYSDDFLEGRATAEAEITKQKKDSPASLDESSGTGSSA